MLGHDVHSRVMPRSTEKPAVNLVEDVGGALEHDFGGPGPVSRACARGVLARVAAVDAQPALTQKALGVVLPAL